MQKCHPRPTKSLKREKELELIQTHMVQKPMLRLKFARVALRASQNAKEDGLGGQARCAGRLRGVCGLCEVSFLHMALPRRGCENVPLNRAVRG